MKLKGKWASFIFGLKGQTKKAHTAAPDDSATGEHPAISADSRWLDDKRSDDLGEDLATRGATDERGERQPASEADEWPNIGTLPTLEEPEASVARASTESGRPVIDHALKVQETGMEHDEHLIVNYTKLQLTQCDRQLKEFMQICPGAYGALISTVDGHELVYTLKRDLPAHKIATMNSSLLALGESIARESQQQLCQFVILENSNGRVVSLRVNDFLMLTCISGKEINLGMLLSVGRNTASKLQEILSD